jgi:fermentation-respiration switch protein FrsA (DUF1100 family)
LDLTRSKIARVKLPLSERKRMRKDIIFKSKGLSCAGWLYLPENIKAGQKAPAIVMAHGHSAVKEQYLAPFAARFAASGFVTLVFDYRYWGASEGEPRCQLFPLEQVEDYRNAITWISEQPEVDPARIGLWGSSYSGGIIAYVASIDKRVKALVGQVPGVISLDERRALNPARWDATSELLLRDRVQRYRTGAVNYMKVVTQEDEPCSLAGKEAYDFFMASRAVAPNWQNRITCESVEKMREFDAGRLIHWIAPAALLMIPAERDYLIPIGAVKAAYERAREPKGMLSLPVGHFEVYFEPWLSRSAGAAVDWFKKYL